MLASFILAALVAGSAVAKPSFPFNKQPTTWEDGQVGHNNCGTKDSSTAMCQTLVANSIDDFCIWGASKPNSGVGDNEQKLIAWCNKAGHGARLMPKGTITGLQVIDTPDFIAFTGRADLTKVNINGYKDGGGELDPHGPDGRGNPIGGLVYSTMLGGDGKTPVQGKEWHMFLEDDDFCLRICKPDTPNQTRFCPHIYDEQGCGFNDPDGSKAYTKGSFQTCKADSGTPPGLYQNGAAKGDYDNYSTWYQGVNPTPAANKAGATSQCTKVATVTYDAYSKASSMSTSVKASSSAKPASATKSSTHKTSSKRTSTHKTSSHKTTSTHKTTTKRTSSHKPTATK